MKKSGIASIFIESVSGEPAAGRPAVDEAHSAKFSKSAKKKDHCFQKFTKLALFLVMNKSIE